MESMETINSETLEIQEDEIKAQENQEDEIKAQEKLNQRREARRRKILENAKNRLERLNGRTTTLNNPTLASATTSDSLDNTHRHQHINGPNNFDNVEFSDPEVETYISPPQMFQTEPLDMNNLFSSLNAETTVPQQQKRHILLRSRVHLILSALVACILTFALRDSTSSTTGYSIFIPAGLCVVVDLLFFREQQPLNPIIGLVLTLCNIRLPSQTQNIIHVISIIQSLLIDLGVFVFSFCIFSCSLVCLNNRFSDVVVMK